MLGRVHVFGIRTTGDFGCAADGIEHTARILGADGAALSRARISTALSCARRNRRDGGTGNSAAGAHGACGSPESWRKDWPGERLGCRRGVDFAGAGAVFREPAIWEQARRANIAEKMG